MGSYEIAHFNPRAHNNMKAERSASPFHLSSPFNPFGYCEDSRLKTVSLSAVCKEDMPYLPRSDSPVSSPPFSWRQSSPEFSSHDFTWDMPNISRMTSPLSSHADCSLTEDGSNTLSPHIASTFEPTDYTNPNSFPGSPRENWVRVDDATYDSHHYPLPFGNGSSSAILHLNPFTKSTYGLDLPAPLPSQTFPLFDEEASIPSRKRKLSIEYNSRPIADQEYQPSRREEEREEDEADGESDYAPRRRKKTRSTRSPKGNKSKPIKIRQPGANAVRKHSDLEDYIAKNVSYGVIPCPHCPEQLHGKTALVRHIAALHTRLFACTFHYYGCHSTFGSKNEWKRHVATKHLKTAYWACDMGRCAPTKPGDQPKEFNRKDLFMQHVRRMHVPTHAGDKADIDSSVDTIARESYKHVRDPPPQSICGFCYAEGKTEDFSGAGSWEHRMEHVGKHLETPGGGNQPCVLDEALETWLIKEKLIVDNGHGQLILRSVIEDTRGKK